MQSPWVHSSNCAADVAFKNVNRNATLNAACFDGETSVHVDEANSYGNKWKDIEQIQVGDKVLSRCAITGEMTYKRVLKVFSHGFRQQYNLACKYAPGPESWAGMYLGPLFVTEEHPFWVKGKNWVAVRDLVAGDELFTSDGECVIVSGVTKCGIHEVFNIEVEGFHTYFVGGFGGLRVHNEKAPVQMQEFKEPLNNSPRNLSVQSIRNPGEFPLISQENTA